MHQVVLKSVHRSGGKHNLTSFVKRHILYIENETKAQTSSNLAQRLKETPTPGANSHVCSASRALGSAQRGAAAQNKSSNNCGRVEDILFICMHTRGKNNTSSVFTFLYFAGLVSQRQTKAAAAVHARERDSLFSHKPALERSMFPTSKDAT